MTKLYSTSFREQEGKYFIDYYTEPKPYFDFGKYGYNDINEGYQNWLNEIEHWKKSVQSIEVHESQVELFKQLCFIKIAKDKNMSPRFISEFSQSYTLFIKQGIEIPSEMVEISIVTSGTVENPIRKKYAFLKQETKPESEYDFYKKQINRIENKNQDDLWAEALLVIKNNRQNDLDKLRELQSKFIITRSNLIIKSGSFFPDGKSEILIEMTNINGKPVSVEYALIKCDCPCHKLGNRAMHIMACCENGFIKIKKGN